jgi:uncharacterized membrane protein YcjF (UPF0283 family)
MIRVFSALPSSTPMKRTISTLAFLGGTILVLSFVLFVINQTAQAVQLASAIHPTAGTAVFVGLVTVYVLLLTVPLVMVLRLPRPLSPPASREGGEFQAHLERLRQRLRLNTGHEVKKLDDEADIEQAIHQLDLEAVRIIKATASQVFLSTAVSQSGRLDTLLVFSMQTRMVWKLAHLYYQRPTLRDMVRLYASVAGTSFVAGELQEVDLSEQVEPVFSAVVGSLGGAVPGFHLVASILANSILSGAADAFLTLRVGMIARRYCGALVLEQPATLRRKATTEAAQHLGGIVAEGSARVTRALWSTSRDKVGDAAKDAYSKLAGVIDRLKKKGQAEVPA